MARCATLCGLTSMPPFPPIPTCSKFTYLNYAFVYADPSLQEAGEKVGP